MQWYYIAAIVLAVPVILLPVLLWYLDIVGSGLAATRAAKQRREHRAIQRQAPQPKT